MAPGALRLGNRSTAIVHETALSGVAKQLRSQPAMSRRGQLSLMTGDEDVIVEDGAPLVCRDCGSPSVRDLIGWLRADDGTPIAEHHTCPQCGLRVGLEANRSGWRPFRLLVRTSTHRDGGGG